MEGALARLVRAAFHDEFVQVGPQDAKRFDANYDAAVVSDNLPDGVWADVVITLPDTRGSGGVGRVRSGQAVHEVNIPDAEAVVELLNEYSRPLIAGSPPSTC